VLNALPHSFIPTDYCENRGCPNVTHSHGLCVGCIVLQHEALLEEVATRSMIDDLRHRLDAEISINAAANLHAMQSNCHKRDSTLDISADRSNQKASRRDGLEEDVTDEMNNTRTSGFGGDLSSIGESSSILDDIDLATWLEDRFNNNVAHNAGIQPPFLLMLPRGGINEPIDADTPIQSNRLFATTAKKKKKKKKTTKNKKKKKKGYVGSMGLRGATAEEANEMITHGELI
jgi:hypothetical protein